MGNEHVYYLNRTTCTLEIYATQTWSRVDLKAYAHFIKTHSSSMNSSKLIELKWVWRVRKMRWIIWRDLIQPFSLISILFIDLHHEMVIRLKIFSMNRSTKAKKLLNSDFHLVSKKGRCLFLKSWFLRHKRHFTL